MSHEEGRRVRGSNAHSPDALPAVSACFPDDIVRPPQDLVSTTSADDPDREIPQEPAGPIFVTSDIAVAEAAGEHISVGSKQPPPKRWRASSDDSQGLGGKKTKSKSSPALPQCGSNIDSAELLSDVGQFLSSEIPRAIQECIGRYEQRLQQQERTAHSELCSGCARCAASIEGPHRSTSVPSVRIQDNSPVRPPDSTRYESSLDEVALSFPSEKFRQSARLTRAPMPSTEDGCATQENKLSLKKMASVYKVRSSWGRQSYLVNEMYLRHSALPRSSAPSTTTTLPAMQHGQQEQRLDLREEQPHLVSVLLALEVAVSIASVATAILAGVQADVPWAHWTLLDIPLLLVFWCDIAVKIWVLGPTGYFRGSLLYSEVQSPRWNCFDFVVTLASSFEAVVEAFVLEHGEGQIYQTVTITLRLLRIFRLAAFARLELARDLSAMLYGFVWGFLPLCWAMSMLLTASYACGLALRMSIGEPDSNSPDYGPEYFGDVRTAVFNVFRCFHGDCTTEDGEPLVLKIGKDYGWMPKLAYTVVTLIITIGLANVVLALFTERIIEGAKFNESMRRRLHRKEEEFKKKMEGHMEFIVYHAEDFYAKQGQEMPYGIDAFGRKALLLTGECFVALVEHPLFIELVDRMGVKLTDFAVTPYDLFLILSPDGEAISVSELLEEITSLRGEARVTLQMLTLSLQMKALRRQSRMATTLEELIHDARHRA